MVGDRLLVTVRQIEQGRDALPAAHRPYKARVRVHEAELIDPRAANLGKDP